MVQANHFFTLLAGVPGLASVGFVRKPLILQWVCRRVAAGFTLLIRDDRTAESAPHEP